MRFRSTDRREGYCFNEVTALSLYLGIARGHEVTMIVDGKAIPVTITNMETERFFL